MGEAVKTTTGGAVAESVPPQQATDASPAAAVGGGAETAGEARVEEWYKDCGGSALHRSTMVNADGLKLACYRWDAEQRQQGIRGKVVLVHGYAVHARFEYLYHDLANPLAPPRYEKSWIQRLAAAGFSVYALDQQSFGASEGLKGKRAHLHDFDALPRDIIQFMHEEVLPSEDKAAPIFLLGISMGGCAVARAVELLAGGSFRGKASPHPTGDSRKVAAETTGSEEEKKSDGANKKGDEGPSATTEEAKHAGAGHKKESQQQQQQPKVLLPLRGLMCLAPMFALDRMKKKNRLILPFAKLLASLSPTLEVAKASKNPLYPAFDTLMKHDPLAYNGKSRARLSYELLYAVSAVQQQAHYLASPETAALTPQSPQPFPVYISAAPAVLIVETKNDTFVDPEGSVYVAAVVDAKLEGNPETIAKYKPYYDTVQASAKPKGHPDATLWMLDNLWHCFTKETPESDELIDRIIKSWLLPHAAAAGTCAAALPREDTGRDNSGKKAGDAPPTEAAKEGEGAAGAAGTPNSARGDKHRKHKKDKTDNAAGTATGDSQTDAAGAADTQETKLPLTPAVSTAGEKQGGEADAAVLEKAEEQQGDQQSAEQDTPADAVSAVKTETQPEESAASPPAAAEGACDAGAVEGAEASEKSADQPAGGEEQKPETEEHGEGATKEEESRCEEQQQETSEAPTEPQADRATAGQKDPVSEAEQQQQPEEKKEEAEGVQEENPAENSEQEACQAAAEQDKCEAAPPHEAEVPADPEE